MLAVRMRDGGRTPLEHRNGLAWIHWFGQHTAIDQGKVKTEIGKRH
jgi:hypothetical protein